MSIASRMSTRGTISLFLSSSVTPAHSPGDWPGRACVAGARLARVRPQVSQGLLAQSVVDPIQPDLRGWHQALVLPHADGLADGREGHLAVGIDAHHDHA